MENPKKIKEAGNVCPQRRSPTLQVVSVLFLFFLALSSCDLRPVFAEINVNVLADAIRKAEGNANYGILTRYKTTTPRQACINTIKHALRDFNGDEKDFISFLGGRYAPLNVSNDPHGLNRFWISNVSYFYAKGIPHAK